MNKIKKFSFSSLMIVFTLAIIYTFFNSASAVENEVFIDGFESGVANWSLGTGWLVVSEYGNNVLQGTQHNFASAYIEGVADKLEFKLKLLNGSIHSNIRSRSVPGGINRYFIGFRKDFSYIAKQLGENFQDLESGPGISLNMWHDVKIEVIGDGIFVYVDDSLWVSVQDEDIIEEGGVSFETLEDSECNIDDVRIVTTVANARETVIWSQVGGYEDLDAKPAEIHWVQTGGPPGGQFSTLLQNPVFHNELYAQTGDGRIFKSVNKGEEWHLLELSSNVRLWSMAVHNDGLFACGDKLYYIDNDEQANLVYNAYWDSVSVSDSKVFVTRGGNSLEDIEILYSDLSYPEYNWIDITPDSQIMSELVFPPSNIDLEHFLNVPNIVAIGDRVLANIHLMIEGSGEYSNSQLLISDDRGITWSAVALDIQNDTIISNFIQDDDDPNHIILTFTHNIMHDAYSPLNTLVKQTFDGGDTWETLTNIELLSNGVTSVSIVGSDYYLICPLDGLRIVKLSNSSYELLESPTIDTHDNIIFGVEQLLFDYDDPTIVYGKTGWDFGLLKSEDNMTTWKKMDSDIIASSPSIVMTHPANEDTIYTSGNVIQESYASRDGGDSWEPFSPTPSGDELRFDPHNSNHLIIIDEMTQIFESFDAGTSFNKIEQHFSSAKILDIEVARDNPKLMYVSNQGVGISERRNGDWVYLSGSPDYAYDLELDPDDSNFLYATYSPKIFENHSSIWRYSKHQAENNGWSEILRVENSTGITSITFDKVDTNNVYAGVVGENAGVYFSSDKGITWNNLNGNFLFSTIHSQNQIAVNPLDDTEVYAAPWGAGLFKTADNSAEWIGLENIPSLSIASIVIHPDQPNIIYAAGRSQPILYKSMNGGNTWIEFFNAGASYARLFKTVLDPSNPDTIYVSAFRHNAVYGSLFKIVNGIPAEITNTIPRAIIDIAVDPTNSDTIYVSLHGESIYKTTNGGNSWQNLDSMPIVGTFDIEIDPRNTDTLYAAAIMGRRCPEELLPPGLFPAVAPEEIGEHGVYKSEDGGLTWVNINHGVIKAPCRALALHPTNPNVIYAAGAGGVYLSIDGGEGWSLQNTGLDFQSVGALSLGANKIYAGSRGGGVYTSDIEEDYSLHWTSTEGPRPEIFNIQVAVDPTNSDVIYASSYPGGMFKTTDGGSTWKDKNFFLPSFEVVDPVRQGYYRFAFDPSDSNILYFVIYGKGVYVSKDGADSQMPLFGDDDIMLGKPLTNIAVDPQDPDVIYVTSEDGVYVSRDRGINWSPFNDGLKTQNIRSLKLIGIEWPPFISDFENGDAPDWELEAGWTVEQDGENYVLQGKGHEWANTGSGNWGDYTFETKIKLLQGGVHVNFRTCDEGRYFFGFSEEGLYLMKTIDEWSTHLPLVSNVVQYPLNQWHDLKIELEGNNIQIFVNDNLEINYTDPDPITLGAIAFETLEGSHILVDQIKVTHERGELNLYAATNGYGIYGYNSEEMIWENLGRTFGIGWWTPWERRMYQFSSIMFDPDIPGDIYLGHFPSGFFISHDNGQTWTDSSLGLGNDGIFSLTMHPHDSNIIWAGTYNGVVKSVDRGMTWQSKSNGIPPEQWPFTVAIDDIDPDIMYIATKNGQNKGLSHRNNVRGVVMKSIDGGENWYEMMNGLNDRDEFYEILIFPSNHEILFLSSNSGVYMSRNAGDSWDEINEGLASSTNQVRDNVADNLLLTPDNDSLLLALQSYGVWKLNLMDLIQTIGIDSVSVPHEAETNETISLEIGLSHSFVCNSSSGAKRKIYVGLYESEQGSWISGVSDEVGIEPYQNIDEESLTYTITLNAPPQEGDYELEARVYYQKYEDWYYNEQDYLKHFEISIHPVQEPEPEPESEPEPDPTPSLEPDRKGIPGFPIQAIAIGIIILVVFLSRYRS